MGTVLMAAFDEWERKVVMASNTSRPVGCNQGDPNAFTTYAGGVMQLTLAEGVTATSSNVVLTQMNQVQFCGDYSVVPDAVPYTFATLPTACRPESVQHLCTPMLLDNGAMIVGLVAVNTDGALQLEATYTAGGGYILASPMLNVRTVYMDSVSCDLASVHYGGYNPS